MFKHKTALFPVRYDVHRKLLVRGLAGCRSLCRSQQVPFRLHDGDSRKREHSWPKMLLDQLSTWNLITTFFIGAGNANEIPWPSDDLTTIENLRFIGDIYRLNRATKTQQIDDVLDRFTLQDMTGPLAGTLSGGQRQLATMQDYHLHWRHKDPAYYCVLNLNGDRQMWYLTDLEKIWFIFLIS